MIAWAESRGYVDRSPLARKGAIELQAEDNERTRRPTAEGMSAILDAATPYMRDQVARETGFRQGTLRKLTGAHIDWTLFRNEIGEPIEQSGSAIRGMPRS
jgi:hypothetical protein